MSWHGTPDPFDQTHRRLETLFALSCKPPFWLGAPWALQLHSHVHFAFFFTHPITHSACNSLVIDPSFRAVVPWSRHLRGEEVRASAIFCHFTPARVRVSVVVVTPSFVLTPAWLQFCSDFVFFCRLCKLLPHLFRVVFVRFSGFDKSGVSADGKCSKVNWSSKFRKAVRNVTNFCSALARQPRLDECACEARPHLQRCAGGKLSKNRSQFA